ncbi:hypothetical protein BTW00_08305 [Psychrobacter sp. C 20.9]|nr:hypothetical protein BTW00_08305 [Psychrobacter sp. C 20.9]
MSISILVEIILQAITLGSTIAYGLIPMNALANDDRLKNLSICVIMRQFFIQKWCDIRAKIQF